jgi:hypothetical protein
MVYRVHCFGVLRIMQEQYLKISMGNPFLYGHENIANCFVDKKIPFGENVLHACCILSEP